MDEPVILFHPPSRGERVLEDTAEHPMIDEGMFVVDSAGVADHHLGATQETGVQVGVQTPEEIPAAVRETVSPSAPRQHAPWTVPPNGAPAGPGGPGQVPPAPPFAGAPPPYDPYGPQGQGPHGPQRHRPSRALMGTAAAVAAAGLGVGVAVGYAAFSGSNPSATRTSSSLASTPIGAVDPGLVNIDTVLGYQTAKAAGTGMVLTSTGIVLTNNHVVEGATSIKATDVGNGRTYNATVLGYDSSADVAVIKLTGASGLSTVTLGNSSTVAVGQSVIALGNAGGTGGTPKVAQGTVTALDQAITASDQGAGKVEHLTGLIESDAPIEPGDSGGTLINTAGQVIGMDTAGSSSGGQASTSFGPSTGANVQAFSIPINAAITIAHQIENGTASSTVHIGKTAFLGVEVSTSQSSAAPATGFGTSTGFVTATRFGIQAGSGVTVAGVVSGSPAASTGLGAGDVITSVDGHTVSSATGLTAVMDQLHPGDTVKVTWTTATGQSVSASVQLAAGPVA